MRKVIGLFAMLCCLFIGTNVAQAVPDYVNQNGYTLVFQEPFNEATLDASQFGYQWSGYEGGAAYDAVSLQNCNLILTTYSYMDNGVMKHKGGCVATHSYLGDDYDFTYGYLEAYIRCDNTTGNNMAFWIESDNMFANPALGASYGNEVDIQEHRASDGDQNSIDDTYHAAIHWGGYGSNHDSVSYQKWINDLGDGYKWYGLLWTPSYYKFYVNDVLVKTWNASFWDWSDWETKYVMSNSPEWIILQSAPSGGWCGNYPAGGYGSLTTSQTKMYVDQVNVYQIL